MRQKKDNVSTFLTVVTILMAIIALFVLFGNAFQDEARYSGFYVMFGDTSHDLEPVPGLIVAFALLIVAIVEPLIAPLFDNKGKMFVYGLEAILLAAAGVIFLFQTQLFSATNPISFAVDLTPGTGTICCIVFSFIGAAFALLGLLRAKKAD